MTDTSRDWATSRCTRCGAAVRVGILGRRVIAIQPDPHGRLLAVQMDQKTGHLTVEPLRGRQPDPARTVDRWTDHAQTCAEARR